MWFHTKDNIQVQPMEGTEQEQKHLFPEAPIYLFILQPFPLQPR